MKLHSRKLELLHTMFSSKPVHVLHNIHTCDTTINFSGKFCKGFSEYIEVYLGWKTYFFIMLESKLISVKSNSWLMDIHHKHQQEPGKRGPIYNELNYLHKPIYDVTLVFGWATEWPKREQSLRNLITFQSVISREEMDTGASRIWQTMSARFIARGTAALFNSAPLSRFLVP